MRPYIIGALGGAVIVVVLGCAWVIWYFRHMWW